MTVIDFTIWNREFEYIYLCGWEIPFKSVQTGPVGTNYARVIPSKEINSKDRDNFWKREEEEERHRIDLETKRREQELKNQEEERRQREELEHKRRLVDANNDANQINGNKAYASVIKRFVPCGFCNCVPTIGIRIDILLPLAHRSVPKPLNPPSPVRLDTSADEMRQQRNREAKELIGSRVDTAKAIFTQNSAASQLSSQKSAPIKPIRNSIAQRINTLNNQQQQRQDEVHSYSFGSSNDANTEAKTIPLQSIDNTATLPESPSIVCDATELNARVDESAPEPIVPPPATIIAQALNIPEDDDTDPYSTIKRSPYTKTGSSSQVTSPEVEKTMVEPSEPYSVRDDDSSTFKNGNNDDLHKGTFAKSTLTFCQMQHPIKNNKNMIDCRYCHSWRHDLSKYHERRRVTRKSPVWLSSWYIWHTNTLAFDFH